MKFKTFIKATVFTCLATPVFAQGVPPADQTPVARATETIVVTGSRIRRQTLDSATPISIVTFEDLKRDGISSPEQFLANLSVTGNGVDNLASQSDVAVEDDQRNVNGFSGANLRGQGSNNTLVLLNGRRLATHGLSGSAVDVNQIPLGALKQIEVQADGASAIYGTDAIGGVMNYILREDVQDLKLSAFTDIAQASGGGEIYSVSATGGYGDLKVQGFNIMGSVSFRENKYLAAKDRDFIDTDQPDRGISPDTRGTPFGTIFARNGTALTSVNAPFLPGTTTRATGGVNVLNLPGAAGCESIEGQTPFRSLLWPGSSNSALACAYDSGKAGTLAQPQETLTYLVRGVAMAGEHKLAVEFAGSNATAARRFSEIQLFPSANAVLNFDYVRTPGNAVVYDRVFNALRDAPTSLVSEANRGLGLGYRWRCLECGQREITTETDTGRFLVSLEGPFLIKDWEYTAGAYTAFSEAASVTGGGYYYRATDAALGITGIRDVLRQSVINPFLLPGQTQTPEALALLKTAEARGVQIAFGRSESDQFDFAINGPLFNLPAGPILAAFGVDLRVDRFQFQGEKRVGTAAAFIEGAPIDSKPALASVSRDVKALFAEFSIPVLKSLEVNLAARLDSYSGFGETVNPKVTFRYRPIDMLAFRGSYNTGFRVPTFTNLFNPISVSQRFESFADPAICPGARPNTAIAGCFDLADTAGNPNAPILQTVSGGKPDLEPEEAELMSVGFVLEPTRRLSLSVDWWRIERTKSIRGIGVAELVANYDIFQENFVRDGSGRIVRIDQRSVNAGGSINEGVELAARGSFDALGGKVNVGLDSSFVTRAQRKVLPTLPYGEDLVSQFTQGGELFLKYKHSAYISYKAENWRASLSQIFKAGYTDQVVDGVLDGLVDPANDDAKTKDYIIYNASASYTGFKDFGITFGIRNLLDTDPPFARSYLTDTGGGTSYEPRVADARGRSFTLSLDYTF